MKKSTYSKYLSFFLLAAAFWSQGAAAGVQVHYQYKLANFSGPVRYHWPKLTVDPLSNEVYAVNSRGNEIKIFNEHGMEIHDFGTSSVLLGVRGMGVAENGDILALAGPRGKARLLRCDYRGEPIAEYSFTELPPEYDGFEPQKLAYRQGRLYLLDRQQMMVVVTDTSGVFQEGYQLRPLLEQYVGNDFELRKKMKGMDVSGFSVGRDGALYFTVPAIFSAYRLSAAGELEGFGTAGSGPGKFGVAAGIITDSRGNIFVSDRLRCVVLVFDQQLKFQTEFGYRGEQPDNLIVPDDLALGDDGNLYVAQAGNRGVSVFRVVSQ